MMAAKSGHAIAGALLKRDAIHSMLLLIYDMGKSRKTL